MVAEALANFRDSLREAAGRYCEDTLVILEFGRAPTR